MQSNVESLCKQKEHELLEKYFPTNLQPSETIGEYTNDLPLKIEAEFREYLVELWKRFSDAPLVLEEQKLRRLMTEDDREAIDAAYEDAKRITLLEQIMHSNHSDVTFYKGLLREYTKDLLLVMRVDFLEEITGHYINCKSFENEN